jgi:hypothetical protein
MVKGSFNSSYIELPDSIKKAPYHYDTGLLVLETGLEPVRPEEHRILSPACLPIPPLEQLFVRTEQTGSLNQRHPIRFNINYSLRQLPLISAGSFFQKAALLRFVLSGR